MRLNPIVSTYWLWLAVAFGAICAIPWRPYLGGHLILATTYATGGDGWQGLLIVHSVVATCLAVSVTALLRTVRGGKNVEQERWTIAGMFLAMTLLAIPLALLRLVDADPSVYIAVVIMFAGYVFWRLVVAWGARLQRAAIRRRMRKYAAQLAQDREL